MLTTSQREVEGQVRRRDRSEAPRYAHCSQMRPSNHTNTFFSSQRKSPSHSRTERTSKANHGSPALPTLRETSRRVYSSAPSSHVWTRVHQRRHCGILSAHLRRAASWSFCHLTTPKARRSFGTRAHISSERHRNAGLDAISALVLQLRMDSTTRLVPWQEAEETANYVTDGAPGERCCRRSRPQASRDHCQQYRQGEAGIPAFDTVQG